MKTRYHPQQRRRKESWTFAATCVNTQIDAPTLDLSPVIFYGDTPS